jgi:hypothetical protein
MTGGGNDDCRLSSAQSLGDEFGDRAGEEGWVAVELDSMEM